MNGKLYCKVSDPPVALWLRLIFFLYLQAKVTMKIERQRECGKNRIKGWGTLHLDCPLLGRGYSNIYFLCYFTSFLINIF